MSTFDEFAMKGIKFVTLKCFRSFLAIANLNIFIFIFIYYF